MKKVWQSLFLGSFSLIALCAAHPAKAAVTISVSPIESGTTLNFSLSDVLSQINKEVRVRVTSTGSEQYQVFQRWIQPLQSVSGGTIDRDFLNFYGLSGSNGSGTLYGSTPELIGISDQLVYTSAQSGLSDNFDLVYQVDRGRLKASGQFAGRLLLSVRPVGSGDVSEVYLDVFIDAQLGLKVTMVGSRSANMIRLSTEHVDDDTDEVELSFEGNIGDISVYQEILTPLVSMANNVELPRGALTVQTAGNSDGPQILDAQGMNMNRTLIYTSNLLEDRCSIHYALNAQTFVPLRAGTYRGRIRYQVESGIGTKNFDFDVEVHVASVFEISLSFPDGPIAFERIFPGSGAQERMVEVSVKTNLQKPYTVSQTVLGALKNEKGVPMDKKYFLIKTVLKNDAKGTGSFPDYHSVSDGDSALYRSDEQGDPETFQVMYRLVPYDNMSPGSYRTEITYTLGQI